MTVEKKVRIARIKYLALISFIWFLGVVFGGSAVFVGLEGRELFTPQILTFEQPLRVETVQAKEVEPVKEWLEAEFSAYSAGDGFTPGTVMASGKTVYVGAVACPRSLPLGTVIEVQGKRLTCEDRMAKRFDGNFDIYMGSRAEALAFGRKTLDYSIVK